MKNCIYCQSAIDDNANFCPNCGGAQAQAQQQAGTYTVNNGGGQQEQQYQQYQQYQTNQQYQQYQQYQQPPVQQYRAVPSPEDAPSFPVALLGFFIPLIGIILFFVWRDEYPQKAKSALKGAIAVIILWALFAILIFGLSFVTIGSGIIETVGGML